MERVNVISKQVIRIRNFELVNFSVLFVALAVALPLITHQFNLAGQIFLPMHIFVFVAALLLGWHTGLLVGLLTPIISHFVSGLPLTTLLPQITVELAIYGLMAGFIREKLGWNLWLSILVAMIVGRVGLGFVVWLLGTNQAGPVNQVITVVKLGWPGILIQLALVPLIVIALKKFLANKFQDV